MQKRIFRSYIKRIFKKISKYIKNYVKDIIEEINVKSFKKYKYNFFFEFIGSFIFVFFISIYMLNSNHNEEYVIKNTKQINPYKTNDIFIPGDNIFDNEINNVRYIKDLNKKINVENILLEKKIQNSVDTNNERKLNNQKEKLENIDKTLENEKKEIKEKIVKEDKTNEPYLSEERNNDTKENIKNKDVESINEDYNNSEELKEKMKKNILENEITNNTNIKIPVLQENKFINKKINIENPTNNLKEKVSNKEPVIKNVENVVFKNDINEFSKIKIADINNINIGDIDKYEVLKNSKSKNNNNHAIYSFFGCLIYVLFVISGAHINPAYTYALWLVEPKKYGFALSTLYVTFQYIGGIVASILCAHIYGSIFIYSLLPKKKIMKTFLCEFLSTFLLTLLLISLYKYKKKFIEDNNNNNNNQSTHFINKKIKKMASSYSFNTYEDIYGYDMFNTNGGKNKLFIHINNKYIKYIMNHIFYLLFIFFSLLFFVFVTNTTLNPLFSTSTLYTYIYFKIFKSTSHFNLYSIFASFLSITKILHMIKFYIQSLPLWIGPYVGSTFATCFIGLFKNDDEEIINVIDTNIYKYNKKKEKIPLINKYNFKQNAYLIEYNDNIDYNSHNYLTPNVF
ncbi:aquaporin, putative [Plasmodium gallinaceum]|uniref:Aquaporin, putative n=1 Tax=Plasmodium gallinaceum TaxID=5849 RepID=A0A1J1GZN7_PLAGA|nr:aquaporin, putative [Plasmodium gallinaceum]CRG97681.1 aquaporin, putative [Plasmodium gallinaceum]